MLRSENRGIIFLLGKFICTLLSIWELGIGIFLEDLEYLEYLEYLEKCGCDYSDCETESLEQSR